MKQNTKHVFVFESKITTVVITSAACVLMSVVFAVSASTLWAQPGVFAIEGKVVSVFAGIFFVAVTMAAMRQHVTRMIAGPGWLKLGTLLGQRQVSIQYVLVGRNTRRYPKTVVRLYGANRKNLGVKFTFWNAADAAPLVVWIVSRSGAKLLGVRSAVRGMKNQMESVSP